MPFNAQYGAKRPKRINSGHGVKLNNSSSLISNHFNSVLFLVKISRVVKFGGIKMDQELPFVIICLFRENLSTDLVHLVHA